MYTAKRKHGFTLAGGLVALPSPRLQRGFTLAEVLITLAIIGVVAAIVIPALLNSSNENEFHAAAKKAYAAFSQATLRLATENGGTLWDDSGDLDQTTWSTLNSNNMRNSYGKYLNFVRVDSAPNIYTKPVKFYKTSGTAIFPTMNLPSTMLADGIFIYFQSFKDCNQTSTGYSGTGTLSNMCGHVGVDVNGLNGPNVIGKDVYGFWIIRNDNGGYQIMPLGNDDGYSCAPNGATGAKSWGCTNYVMTDRQLP